MQTMNSAIEQYMEMVTLQVDNCRVGSFFDVTVVVIEEDVLDDITVLSEYVARMRYDLDKLHEQIDECVRNLLH